MAFLKLNFTLFMVSACLQENPLPVAIAFLMGSLESLNLLLRDLEADAAPEGPHRYDPNLINHLVRFYLCFR